MVGGSVVALPWRQGFCYVVFCLYYVVNVHFRMWRQVVIFVELVLWVRGYMLYLGRV